VWIKLPHQLWFILSVVNVFIFGIGFTLADRQLMLIALLSFISCIISHKLSKERDDDREQDTFD